MKNIIPHLWFDKEAEEAVAFYTSIFSNSKVGETTRYSEVGHEIHGMQSGTVMTMEFEIEGKKFLALNGGPVFTFTPAISFMVHCKSAEEVDRLWDKLKDGGTALMPIDTYPFSPRYGWIKDKFGLSWQLILREESKPEKIIPSLMFANEIFGRAEEAMKFYTSVFKNSKIGAVSHYGPGSEPNKEGTIMFADFELEGNTFAVMDSALAHEFKFNEAISFMVPCDTQEEIDYFWEKLSAVPESEQCGWVKDKFGVSWQITPNRMVEMLNDPDKEKSNRAMQAMLQMKKIDIAKLEEAFEGK